MKKYSVLFATFLFIAMCSSCVNDNNSYKMPYKPGINLNEEAFQEHKKLWAETSIKDYSYTYSYYNDLYPCEDCVIDVIVRNGEVSEYMVKEFDKTLVSEIPESNLGAYEDFLTGLERFKDSLLIENVYSTITKYIEESLRDIEEYPDCYYANYEFDFSEKSPFMHTCIFTTKLMQEGLVGDGASIEIKIENFKEN